MEYINILLSFMLFVVFAFLTGYNILYAIRTAGVNRQLGIGLPSFVRSLFTIMIIASIVSTGVTLIIFIQGVASL